MAKDSKFLAVFFIQTSLGFKPTNFPEGITEKLVEKAPINYQFLDDEFLSGIEEMGVPARSNLPFAASWASLIEDLREKNPHAPMWLATLLYMEWSFMYWHNQVEGRGLKNEIYQKAKNKKLAEDHIGGNNIASIGITPQDIQVKWWIDDVILKIRALWDKLPHALAELSAPRIKKLKGKSHNSRIKNLVKNKGKLIFLPQHTSLFERLIKEMQQIEYIREYRNAEAHLHARPSAEVFGFYGRHESLVDVWGKLEGELNRCREALLCTIGLILFAHQKV